MNDPAFLVSFSNGSLVYLLGVDSVFVFAFEFYNDLY